jgi:prepilin-type N-terminal cleavage/methylation domain-containing protein
LKTSGDISRHGGQGVVAADCGTGAFQCRWAFTLIELLVVMAIMSILAALVLPVVNRGKESARSARCLSNLHQIGLGLQLYVSDNNNRLPALVDWSASLGTNSPVINRVLLDHVGSSKVFWCPSDREGVFEQTGSSYSWNFFLNGQNADQLKLLGMNFSLNQIPLAFDKEQFHRARGAAKAKNYLYADQHLKNLLELQSPFP